jgi:hypothetical protein
MKGKGDERRVEFKKLRDEEWTCLRQMLLIQ